VSWQLFPARGSHYDPQVTALILTLAAALVVALWGPWRLVSEEGTMQQLFVVMRTRGPAWQESRSLEEQADWAAHASFMNGLLRDGAVILGGPLEGTADVVLVMRARTADEVRSWLARDPWAGQDLLRVTRVAPWTLRLGSLG
jgi:uncharacterized protein YciI